MRTFRQEFRVKETFFVLGNGWVNLFEWMCCHFGWRNLIEICGLQRCLAEPAVPAECQARTSWTWADCSSSCSSCSSFWEPQARYVFFIRGFSGHQYFPIAGWLDPGINSFHHGSSGWPSPQYTWPNNPNHLFQSLVTLVPQAPTGSTWHRSWWCCDSVAGGSFGLCRSAAPGHSEWTHGGTLGLFSVEDGVMWLRSWRFLHLSKTRVLFTLW